MKRKKLILVLNAIVGPMLLGFALVAWKSEVLRTLVANEDGAMRGTVAVGLTITIVYSLAFQLWLAKMLWEPRIACAFDQFERR